MRNVLIYFDLETKRLSLDKMGKILAPDGALFLGAAETTLNIYEGFERTTREQRSYYRFCS